MTSALTRAQYEFLVRGVAAERVQRMQNQSHLEAWDVRRHLIRAFGFGGFDITTLRCELIERFEHPPTRPDGSPDPNGKIRWTVVYRAEVRLTIKAADGTPIATYEDGATGDACNQPSIGDAHDHGMKTALSQALKRCAVNLGDQFGLSLYDNGSSQPVVLGSLSAPPKPPTPESTNGGAPVEPAVADLPTHVDSTEAAA